MSMLKANIDSIKGQVSSIISDQLPEFVRSDHTTFVTFIEAYYEWLEENGNAIETTRNAKLYNDIDNTVDAFVTYFKENYLVDIPDSILNDKRTLLKNIKEFYQAKGTDKSIILLFRMLFNEEVSVYYPKQDMLRVSDGQFTSDIIINIKDFTGDILNIDEIVGKQLLQKNVPLQPDINQATGLIENFIAFQSGTSTIYQLTLTQNSVAGTFVAGQIISVPTDTGLVEGEVDNIITGIAIPTSGAYYNTGDPLVTTNKTPRLEKEDDSGYVTTESGDIIVSEEIGNSAAFDINTVGKGSIQEYLIENGGRDYAVGEALSYTDGGLGANANAVVERIEGRLISEADGAGILLETGHNILAGDLREIAKEDGDALLLETGDKIVPDDADHKGIIHELKIVDEGTNYDRLPLVGVTTTNGTGAIIKSVSNNLGRITGVIRTNLGSGYTSPPDVVVQENLILENIQGTFIAGEAITSQPYKLLTQDESSILLETGDALLSEISTVENGTIQSIDNDRNLYKIKLDTVEDTFRLNTSLYEKDDICLRRSRITGATSGATATVCQVGSAIINPQNGTVSSSEGVLFGADGRLSESSKSIQDSFYYQDFSYVIKVGNSINVWRDAVKRILHPVGLALFGEVSVATSVSARAWGGSEFRLNGNQPRFKELQILLEVLREVTPVARLQKLELEIFTEVVHANMFETRIVTEDGNFILMEDSEEVNTNKGKNYLRGEELIIGTEAGGVMPTLQFPSHPTAIANIDATAQFLKDITLFLRDAGASFDESVNIPNSPNNATADGNQHNKTDQTPDITILLQTFETWAENLTAGTSVKHTLEIYKQIARVAQIVQNVVTLLLPTQKSPDLDFTFRARTTGKENVTGAEFNVIDANSGSQHVNNRKLISLSEGRVGDLAILIGNYQNGLSTEVPSDFDMPGWTPIGSRPQDAFNEFRQTNFYKILTHEDVNRGFVFAGVNAEINFTQVLFFEPNVPIEAVNVYDFSSAANSTAGNGEVINVASNVTSGPAIVIISKFVSGGGQPGTGATLNTLDESFLEYQRAIDGDPTTLKIRTSYDIQHNSSEYADITVSTIDDGNTQIFTGFVLGNFVKKSENVHADILHDSTIHLIASLGLEDAHLHESYGSAKLGPTGYSLDRFKFLFPPYSAGTREIDRGGRIYRGTYDSSKLTSNYSGSNTSNDDYWDTYANTNISHLNEIVNNVDDLVNFPGRKLDFTFDSEIFLRSS